MSLLNSTGLAGMFRTIRTIPYAYANEPGLKLAFRIRSSLPPRGVLLRRRRGGRLPVLVVHGDRGPPLELLVRDQAAAFRRDAGVAEPLGDLLLGREPRRERAVLHDVRGALGGG